MQTLQAADDPLRELTEQQKLVRDRVRGVVHGHSAGVYLYGPPGTSKTHLVRTTLEQAGVPHAVRNGHLTPRGLFEVLTAHRAEIVVLDDVASLFSAPIATQILLGALGSPHDGGRERVVTYQTANGHEEVTFSGAIVMLANVSLEARHDDVVGALHDRVHVMHYAPTDEQLAALIRDLSTKEVPGLTRAEAGEVAEFLLGECTNRGVRPSLRLYVDKAVKDYRQWKAGQTETDWHDLVRSSIRSAVVQPIHETRDISRAERVAAERRIALAIFNSGLVGEDAVTAWTRRTGKERSALYRRRRELVVEGLVAG